MPLRSATIEPSAPRFRWLTQRLPQPDTRRLVVLTGARQTDKTSLARAAYPTLRHMNLGDVEVREQSRSLRTVRWADNVGESVSDEAQKEPSVFGKVEYAFDERDIDFSVLLGSSRILSLDRVRESLAGRAFLYELWPLLASEIRHSAEERPTPPLLDRLLAQSGRIDTELDREPEFLFGPEDAARRDAIEHLACWGGMPELLRLSDDDRRE